MTEEERRAKVVAGIRALADLIESDTQLPAPHAVHAQHSILGDLDAAGEQLVRDVAEHLGITQQGYAPHKSYMEIDDRTAFATHLLSTGSWDIRIDYTVHGSRDVTR